MVRSSTLAILAAATGLIACREPPAPQEQRPRVAPMAGVLDAGAAVTGTRLPNGEEIVDAGSSLALVGADGGAYEGPVIGAMAMYTPIWSDMEVPERHSAREGGRRERDRLKEKSGERVIRLGYMRHGEKAPVFPEAHPKPNCIEGWYELVAGGFVCGKYATLDLNHPRVRLAPHPPEMDAALPYTYGYNLTNGTPLYRVIPSKDARTKLEPWLKGGRAAAAAAAALKAKSTPRLDENPYLPPAEVDLDAGAGLGGASRSTTRDPLGLGMTDDDAGGVPWYLREFDGGKPQVTLDELRGEGPMVRRMVRGFFVALDKEMKVGPSKWWRTTAGYVAPHDRIAVHRPPTDFHGLWLKDNPPAFPPPLAGDGGAPPPAPPPALALAGDAGSSTSPVAPAAVGFILWKSHKYLLSADHKRATMGEVVPRFTTARLTGQTTKIGGVVFNETDEGWWMRDADGARTRPGPAPADLLPGEKWVDVNLTTQTLVAFEGTTPVYATLVSSGKKDKDDPEKDHSTPVGSFRIWEKHVAATMDGDVASDGPYSIEDVPWIMYFKGSYALHGAFWHASFGKERSHGCVNLSPPDARALFGWTEPALPPGWHGVSATERNPGTRVVVHE